MLDQIVDDWETWVRSSAADRRRTRWGVREPGLADRSIDRLRSPRWSPETDALQAALVGLAQEGDGAALATLVVQLRPGLIHLIQAVGRRRGDPLDGVADEVVGEFAAVALGHSLARRPRRIAANLLLDTRQRLWLADGGRRRADRVTVAATEPVLAALTLADHPANGPESMLDTLDLVATVADAVEALPGTEHSRRLTAEVAYRAWILDQAASTIGDEVGLRPDAVRARLSRLRASVRRPDDAPAAPVGAVGVVAP